MRDECCEDPRPVIVENDPLSGQAIVVCEHASHNIPNKYHGLGLPREMLLTHIGWDPGALDTARGLAARLDCPLVASGVSRLVVDCNRALDARDLIPETSAGIAIPGNASLDEVSRQRRIDEVHRPFHDRLDEILTARQAGGRATALVTVHSFTPVFAGRERPWHAGLIQDRDERLIGPIETALEGETGLTVGRNVPYSRADGVLFTLAHHAERRGLASVMIEIRNDLLASGGDRARWAERLSDALGPILCDLGDAATVGEGGAGE